MDSQTGNNADYRHGCVLQHSKFVGGQPAPYIYYSKGYDDNENVIFNIHEQYQRKQQEQCVQQNVFLLKQLTGCKKHHANTKNQNGFLEHS